jgi:uncharacterized protein involved in exopolysaccharide biosynthesis
VSYRIDDDRYDEPEEQPTRASWVSTADEPEQQPKRASWISIAVVALVLACIGVGLAFFWRAYGGSVVALPSIASVSGPAAAPPGGVAGAAEKGLSDMQAVQQQLAGQMQAATQLLASQQAEIKRLSDQVAALTGKIDALQQPVAPPVSKQVAPVKKKPAAPAVAANPAGAAAPPPPPPPLQLSR